MNPRFLLAALVALSATGVAASPACAPAPVDATLDTPLGVYYLVNDECQPDCIFSTWVYQETNGEAGLQHEGCVNEEGREVPADHA